MRCIRALLAVSVVAGTPLFAPWDAAAQATNATTETRRAEEEFIHLRSELDRVNAEIATLKSGNRSMRDDYRLRERMADAEALAQKLTQAERRLRTLGVAGKPSESSLVVTPTPQALPQDGSVELEAKADLLADRASKLAREADVLSSAAEQLRSRKALRRRAGAWDRDPFAGLESSRRSLAISTSPTPVPPPKLTNGDSGDRGGAGAPALAPATPPPSATVGPLAVTDSPGKGTSSFTLESGSAAKTSPLPASTATDRQSLEQRLYLDPTVAAELRQALGAGATLSDPEALDRAAAALRARANILGAQAQTLRAKSRAP
jgi:hypothetical protein